MSTIDNSTSRSRVVRRLAVLIGVLGLAVVGSVAPAAALPRVTAVVVSAQTGTAVAGTASDVTFQVNVTKGNSGFFGNATTASLSVGGLAGFTQCATTTAPGPCRFFSPSQIELDQQQPRESQSSTLTIQHGGSHTKRCDWRSPSRRCERRRRA